MSLEEYIYKYYNGRDKFETILISNSSVSLLPSAITSIGDMSNFEIDALVLTDTLLSDLKGIEKIKNLKYLNLNNNNLISIDYITELSSLIVLKLRSNSISDLKGVGKLKNLKCLDISGNKLSSIKGVEDLKDLESLYFNNLGSFTNKNCVEDIREILNLSKLFSINFKNVEKLKFMQTYSIDEIKSYYKYLIREERLGLLLSKRK